MWELILTDPQGIVLERIPVPGGWLYRQRIEETIFTATFVPGAITPAPDM